MDSVRDLSFLHFRNISIKNYSLVQGQAERRVCLRFEVPKVDPELFLAAVGMAGHCH